MADPQGTTTTTAHVAQLNPELKLDVDHMPEAATASNKQAVGSQKLYQRSVAAEQILLAIAAAGSLASLLLGALALGVATTYVEYAVIAALAGTVAIRGLRSLGHPDVNWYASRALSEELQSQSWRYAMRVVPFEDRTGDAGSLANAPDFRFVEECRRIRESSGVRLPAASQGDNKQVTQALQRVRDASLPERIAVYKRDRLHDQHGYYSGKAKLYQRRARQWNILILVVEALALVASGAKFIGLPSIDLFGLAGTVVAGAAAWVQMKQFSALSRRYSAMARNLEGYLNVLDRRGAEAISEADWSYMVNHIEQLLENEHEGWLNLQRHLHAQPQQPGIAQAFEEEVGKLPRP